jgi:hypothetical protein
MKKVQIGSASSAAHKVSPAVGQRPNSPLEKQAFFREPL